MKKFLLIIASLFALCWGQNVKAQAFTFTPSQMTYSENFDGMTALGTTLPTGWTAVRYAGTGTVGQSLTMAVAAPASNSGTVYNAGATGGTERALGTLASGSTVPRFGTYFLNNTGTSISKLNLAGVMEQWRTGTANTVLETCIFEYSIDATDIQTGNWTPISSFDLVEKLTSSTVAAAIDGNLPENQTSLVAILDNLNWQTGSNLWIRWTDANDTGSDGLFCIDDLTATATLAIPTISITSPVAGTQWAQGSTQTITWTASGTNTNLMIEYTGNASGTPTWNTINPSIDASLGTWTLTLPADLPVGDDYKIRITDIPQTVQAETGLLSIIAAPAPVATFAPANAATGVGIASDITVSFDVPVRNIDDTEITNANVASLITLKTTDAAGTAVPFTATVDAAKKVITINPDADLAYEQLYYVAIAPVEGLSNNATTEQTITFTTAASLAPSLADVAVSGTGPYYAGDEVTITWTSKNITDVQIEAWIPSENKWEVIIPTTPSTGSVAFQIPVDAQYSTEYKLRVSDVATPSVTAESNTFTILAALNNVSIAETAPYYAGDEITVKWEAKNITTVKIELLDPATSTWSDLATGVPAADGTKKVTLPASLQTNIAYKIKVTNEKTNTGVESAAFEAIAVVNDLITLRSVPAGVKVKFAGIATVTYTQAYRNQKFIQDGTAAIVIDDPTAAPGFVSGYNIGDGITNIVGKIAVFNQLVEFTPIQTTGEHATGITITPEVRTLESLTPADQSKLVKIENFSFKNPSEFDATGKFVKGKNYEIDGIAKTAMAFRTNYYDADYITGGGYVPVGPISSICIVGQNNAQMQITSRSWADMTVPTVADFMADKTFVLTGENVSFMDMSSNHPTSWEWTFEGGTPATSTEQNPVVTYAAKGTYAVTLKATTPSGVSNTVTKTDYISIGVVGIPTTSAVVTIYPNPTSGMLYITNPTKGLQTVEIFNTVGKQVNAIASAKESISIDLTGQDKGMYLVKITNNETKTAQFKKIVLR